MTADLTRYRAMLARKPGRAPRIGQVTDVAMADMKVMVLLDDGEVEADLTDQVMDYIGVVRGDHQRRKNAVWPGGHVRGWHVLAAVQHHRTHRRRERAGTH